MPKASFLIIGSVAAKHWFDSFRDPVRDIDILTPYQVRSETPSKFGVEVQWHDVANEILESATSCFASPEVLMTLKFSHAPWDIHRRKTLYDITFFQERGVGVDLALSDKLREVWRKVYGSKHKVDLSKKLDTFFSSDAVARQFDHDKLHELLALGTTALHHKIRKDPSKAACSKDLFLALPPSEQLGCAIEETCVIAVERFRLHDKMKKHEWYTAVNGAHGKLITSMTSGWFNDFLILQNRLIISECFKRFNEVKQKLEKINECK